MIFEKSFTYDTSYFSSRHTRLHQGQTFAVGANLEARDRTATVFFYLAAAEVTTVCTKHLPVGYRMGLL
jgi:hypothetical protein